MDDDKDLDQLRQQTESGDRIDEASNNEDRRELTDAILKEIQRFDNTDDQPTVSVWDQQVAAFLEALDDDRAAAIGEQLADRVGVNVDEYSESTIMKLALRVGFDACAPDEWEAARDARREHEESGL